MHTILGAGGAIGNELAKELLQAGRRVRLVSRHPKPVAGAAESVSADLSNVDEVTQAAAGSSVVYLTVGLKYDLGVWQEFWPRILHNTIEACKQAEAKLIFFDNVYMYGRVDGPMTEATPYAPCSRKGELRARLATGLMHEAKAGNLKALIARSADFYGPVCRTGILNLLVLDRLAGGKRAWWLGDDKPRHSFTFTPDAAKALVRLADEDSAFRQVWHLPTAHPALTGRQWIELCAEATGKLARRFILTRPIVRLMGLLDPAVRELYEMLYQNEADYIFDSSKFEKTFGVTATPPAAGVKAVVAAIKQAATR